MREAKGVAAVVLLAAASAGLAWGFASSQAGCQLQGSCDSATVFVPAVPRGVAGAQVSGQGFQAGAGVYGSAWQTGPIEGQWMYFPGGRTYVIYPQLADGGAFVGPYLFPSVEISADPNPDTNPGSNFAPAAGNVAEISALDGGGTNGFEVTNATCSPYYLWMQVTQERPTAPAPADAATE